MRWLPWTTSARQPRRWADRPSLTSCSAHTCGSRRSPDRRRSRDRDPQYRWLLAYRQLLDTHQGAVRLVAGDLPTEPAAPLTRTV